MKEELSNIPRESKKKKGDVPSEGMSDLLVIKSNLMISSTSIWVIDFGSNAYLCTSMQDLVESKELRKGEMILRVGNGTKVAAVAIDTYPLRLPSKFNLVLRDCYYVLATSKNLISISVLAQDGYNFNFNKDYCFIYFKNKVVAGRFLIDSLYHLHVDISVNIFE